MKSVTVIFPVVIVQLQVKAEGAFLQQRVEYNL